MLKIHLTWLLLLSSCLSFGAVAATAQTNPGSTKPNMQPESIVNPVLEIEPVGGQTSPIASSVVSPRSSPQSNKIDENRVSVDNTDRNVPSAAQSADLRPTEGEITALKSLDERYDCIIQGDRPFGQQTTRNEFAASLNACLNIIAAEPTGANDRVTKADLETLQRLQESFKTELAQLKGKVDALDAKTTALQNSQFSTTTKLKGEVIIGIAGGSGANPNVPGSGNANLVLNNRVRLNLVTSFTGKDLLITGLQTYNLGGGTSSIQGRLGYADSLGLSASNVRLGYEPQFPGVNPTNLSAVNAGSVNLYKLLYITPVTDKLTMFAGTNAEVTDAFPTISPFANEGQGAISRFGQGLNAAVRVSGGTSGTGLAAAGGLIWTLSDTTDFRALYGSVNAAVVSNLGFPGTPLGSGLFGGSSVIAAQLTVKPSPTVDIGLNYANSYHQINILGTGLAAVDIGSITGGAATEPIKLNSIGSTLTWRLAPKTAFNVSGSWIFANLVNVNASTTFTSWMAGFHFQDVFKEGNTAGILFGQPLARSSAGGLATIPTGLTATPYQLEGYFNYKVNDNVSITPGVFAIFNPEGINNAPTTTVGAVRTTFTF